MLSSTSHHSAAAPVDDNRTTGDIVHSSSFDIIFISADVGLGSTSSTHDYRREESYHDHTPVVRDK